jgi:hypothetical protein
MWSKTISDEPQSNPLLFVVHLFLSKNPYNFIPTFCRFLIIAVAAGNQQQPLFAANLGFGSVFQ